MCSGTSQCHSGLPSVALRPPGFLHCKDGDVGRPAGAPLSAAGTTRPEAAGPGPSVGVGLAVRGLGVPAPPLPEGAKGEPGPLGSGASAPRVFLDCILSSRKFEFRGTRTKRKY